MRIWEHLTKKRYVLIAVPDKLFQTICMIMCIHTIYMIICISNITFDLKYLDLNNNILRFDRIKM